jgi:hypothetical protein
MSTDQSSTTDPTTRPRAAQTLGLLIAFGAVLFIGWWVGIRSTPRPDEGYSLGFVARYDGPSAEPGGNEPISAPGPAPASPEVVRFGPGAGIRLDITVSVDPGLFDCGDASVDVVATGSRGFWRQHPALADGPTRFALGWDRFTKPTPIASEDVSEEEPILASASPDRQAGLRPIIFPTDYLEDHRIDPEYYIDPDPETGGKRAAGGTIREWGAQANRQPIHFRFQANWVTPRSFGTCWVVLPALPANGTIPGHLNALHGVDAREAVTRSSPPAFGRTTLFTGGELGESTPAPDGAQTVALPEVFEEQGGRAAANMPAWSCRPTPDLSYVEGEGADVIPPNEAFTPDTCAAISVVETPWATENANLYALLIGLLIGALANPLFKNTWALTRHVYRRLRERR